MAPEIFWIPVNSGRIGIMARPRAGEWLRDEIDGWRGVGLNTVVSLLEGSEIRELSLIDEPNLCREAGLRFISFPIPDRGVPASTAATIELVEELASALRQGSSVAVHCRAGIGRSSLIAACVLLKLGMQPVEAFRTIGRARRVAVPDTVAQEQWLCTFAKAATST
jgi:protein-tyrosine phosphatase